MIVFGDRACSCGSGLPRYDLTDARGIFCCYVCDACERDRMKSYLPEIFTDPSYDVGDAIE